MTTWYTRPVLFVSDVPRSVDFYVERLGFRQDWRHEEGGKPIVAQVGRAGCELILTSQWPEKVGGAQIFVSLDEDELHAVRAEFERKGVEVKEGNWGYRLAVVHDPDGNELQFPYPNR
jgi:catechol 2,3-dioxygenase-like lactoylglutathione lyase family enzyme